MREAVAGGLPMRAQGRAASAAQRSGHVAPACRQLSRPDLLLGATELAAAVLHMLTPAAHGGLLARRR